MQVLAEQGKLRLEDPRLLAFPVWRSISRRTSCRISRAGQAAVSPPKSSTRAVRSATSNNRRRGADGAVRRLPRPRRGYTQVVFVAGQSGSTWTSRSKRTAPVALNACALIGNCALSVVSELKNA
jgi:hypothetical protein